MRTDTTVAEFSSRLWEHVYQAVDKLSVPKAIAISGGGGGFSLASAFGVIDLGGIAHGYMLAMGVFGVTVSVAIGVLKLVQQRREMKHWQRKNPDAA